MLNCVCLRILASSRIPRYDLGRQNPLFLRWFCHSNTPGNVIYVDASSPYPGGVLMGNLGTSLTTSGNPGFPTHTKPTNPNPSFQQPYYQIMAYGPNIPPTGMGVPHGPIPDIIFPRTPDYVTPNPIVEGEVNDGVRDQIARTLREFGFTPKGRARSYRKLYPEYF
jgi:hypothetical protein